MRVIIFIVFIVLSSCTIQRTLHLGGGFEANHVKINLIGVGESKIIFKDTITSNPISGTSGKVSYKYNKKEFKYISISIDNEFKLILPLAAFRRKGYNIIDFWDSVDRDFLKVHLRVLKD